ncbi:MAG: hypothetical protein KGR98_12540, partial [Verrucomicrobia bacterium]|nr:hypothetical protein [Verrucomicrobiota bacterium]
MHSTPDRITRLRSPLKIIVACLLSVLWQTRDSSARDLVLWYQQPVEGALHEPSLTNAGPSLLR